MPAAIVHFFITLHLSRIDSTVMLHVSLVQNGREYQSKKKIAYERKKMEILIYMYS